MEIFHLIYEQPLTYKSMHDSVHLYSLIQVLDRNCQGIEGATVEIWYAGFRTSKINIEFITIYVYVLNNRNI